MGQLEFGIYQEDCDQMPPEEIEANYGVFGSQRPRMAGQTGAGHPDDEEDILDEADTTDEWADVDEEVLLETDPNIRHEPIAVPDHCCPFTLQELEVFHQTLGLYTTNNFIPFGYGMRQEEWEDGQYPSIQIIPSGRRGSRELQVGLPHEIWISRSETWVRGLYILNFIENRRGLVS